MKIKGVKPLKIVLAKPKSKKAASKSVSRDKKVLLKTAWERFCREDWPFEPEYRFHSVRRWRFDWASVEHKLAIELDGVTYYGKAIGGHQSADGVENDHDKMNAATLLGWRVLHFSQRVVKRDPIGCVNVIRQAMQLPILF